MKLKNYYVVKWKLNDGVICWFYSNFAGIVINKLIIFLRMFDHQGLDLKNYIRFEVLFSYDTFGETFQFVNNNF